MSQQTDLPEHVAAWRAGRISDPRHLAPRLAGVPYLKLLAAAHAQVRPTSYLEIGSRRGHSLAFATAPTVAIDPVFTLPEGFAEARPHVRLFAMTSDDFFAQHDPATILDGPIDFAFLDGMHKFEFLLRDFMNTERHAAPNSIVVLHDCVPFSSAIVGREQRGPKNPVYDVNPGAWAGDVWKVLPILEQYRPDLQVTVLDAPPTGLVFISRLDPGSRVLDAAYEAIVGRFMDADIAQTGVSAFVESLKMVDSRAVMRSGGLIRTVAPGRDAN